jgi:hypothetical protein
MRNSYKGRCKFCGERVVAGEGRVVFIGGIPNGVEHVPCASAAARRRIDSPEFRRALGLAPLEAGAMPEGDL